MPTKKLLVLVFFMVAAAGCFAQSIPLNPNHPDRHVVVKGDTLWDIAERFLRDPWRWPDVWYVNPQIANPHLIYPGDVISLTYGADGRPQLRVTRGRQTIKLSPTVRESKIERAIPTIPLDAIQQFLTRPLVVEPDELEGAGYVVHSVGEHIVVGAGDRVYARGLDGTQHQRYSIFRKGQVLQEPDLPDGKPGKILGYEAIFVGDANLVRDGDPATLAILTSTREVQIGDRILPTSDKEANTRFLPHAPSQPVEGIILSVLDGVSQIGQHSVVSINKGAGDGMEVGHVLGVYQAGQLVRDQVTPDPHDRVRLPDEKAALVMVFRTFEHVSFALVMNATRNFHVYDYVRNPDL